MKGLLLIDKPKDYTSHDVVSVIRKLTSIKKVGHTGTLDPMATGLLPICIGRATKVAGLIRGHRKSYIASFEFGYETDTYDSTGTVTEEGGSIPRKDEVLEAIQSFKGVILQEPPMYSAIKVKGKKLYEFARKGITLERKLREVEIFAIELLEYENGIGRLLVSCSSGTYIRSLIRDLGIGLKTYATMTDLRRSEVGDFTLDKAYSLDYLKSLNIEDIALLLLPIDSVLEQYNFINLPDFFYDKLLNGVNFIFNEKPNFDEDEVLRVYCKGEFIGLGKTIIKDNRYNLKIIKFLN